MTDNVDKVTHVEVYRQLGVIQGQLSQLNTSLADRDKTVRDALDTHKTRLNTHSARLGSVERRQSWFLGGLAAIVAVGGAAWAHIARTGGGAS